MKIGNLVHMCDQDRKVQNDGIHQMSRKGEFIGEMYDSAYGLLVLKRPCQCEISRQMCEGPKRQEIKCPNTIEACLWWSIWLHNVYIPPKPKGHCIKRVEIWKISRRLNCRGQIRFPHEARRHSQGEPFWYHHLQGWKGKGCQVHVPWARWTAT